MCGRSRRGKSVLGRGLLLLSLLAMAPLALAAVEDFFAIEVLDSSTNRGIPMVELETVNHIRFVTDSNGLIAINDPDLLDRTVYFTIRAPGYEVPADAQGFTGQTVLLRAGVSAKLRLARTNIAERLYRLTGSGIYRDSVMLGREAPIEEPLLNGSVVGQDSMLAAQFRNHIFWFGGDTLRIKYPLGQYWTSGAISDVPGPKLDPEKGINLHYLVDNEGFARPMWPRPREGTIWTDGVCVLTDGEGRQQMVAHYAHMKSLTEVFDHGVGVFDEQKNQFGISGTFPKTGGWRFLNGHPTQGRGLEADMLFFPAPDADVAPFAAVRAKADLEALKKPESYQAFTYLAIGGRLPERDRFGRLVYDWKPGAEPVGVRYERALVEAGYLDEAEALYQVRDLETRELIDFQAGSIAWNEFRQKWIMIASQVGERSAFSGDVWYSEADSPVGPWRIARRIATHGDQSFYSPVHHPFLDQAGGRVIFFEGTFANTFNGTYMQTARYDFNQLMYRLDLADPRLRLPDPVPRLRAQTVPRAEPPGAKPRAPKTP